MKCCEISHGSIRVTSCVGGTGKTVPMVGLADTRPAPLSNEEIIAKGTGREANIRFANNKLGNRACQTRWQFDVIMREDNQDRLCVCDASTGSGKTTAMTRHLNNLNRFLGDEKSFNIILAPSNTQEVLVKLYNDLNKLPGNVGVFVSDSFSKKISIANKNNERLTVFHNNPDELYDLVKNKDHIICIGSHQYYRDHVKGWLTEKRKILKKRRLFTLIDEPHSELHTDGTKDPMAYVKNTENGVSSYSTLGIEVVGSLIDFGFYITGFTGTPSLQQSEKTDYNGPFLHIGTTDDEKKEIQINNTWYDGYTTIQIDYSQPEPIKHHAQQIADHIISRRGITHIWLKPDVNPQDDEYTVEKYEKYIAPLLGKDRSLHWFGDDEKYCYVKKKGSDEYEKKYFSKKDNVQDILKAHPRIDNIVSVDLLIQGFDCVNLNTPLFLRPINKINTFMRGGQQLGRAVRPGEVGMHVVFASETKKSYQTKYGVGYTPIGFENCHNMMEDFLEKKTVLPKDAHDKLKNGKWKPPFETIISKSEAEILKTLILEDIPLVKTILNMQIEEEIRDDKKMGSKTDIKTLSDMISKWWEKYMGKLYNVVMTANNNEEDGFFYLYESDKSLPYDIKSKILKVKNSDNIPDYKSTSIQLKDKFKGDGKVNNHIIHIFITTEIENNKISKMDIHIVEITKKYSDENIGEGNSIGYKKVKDLSLLSFTI